MALVSAAPTGEVRIERDRYGRPLIHPEDGGDPVAYTRSSSLGKVLDDETGLTKWKQRMAMIGCASRKDLIIAVNAHREDKTMMGELVEKAMDAAESGAAATAGTALHELMDAYDKGRTPYMPEEYRADITAYQEATAALEFVRSETFVVDDELRVAGTYDNLFRTRHGLLAPDGTELPEGTLIIADKKTGSDVKFGHTAWAVQLSTYAHGLRYDIAERKRLPAEDICRDWGLIVHVPVAEGTAQVYWIDLKLGRELAHLSVKVREMRKSKTMVKTNLAPSVESEIRAARSTDDLADVWERAVRAKRWSEDNAALAKARWAELRRQAA